jgi:hypothetical protein
MNATGETTWTVESVQSLIGMARERVPPSVMSLKLKRPLTAVRAKLRELGISPLVEV